MNPFAIEIAILDALRAAAGTITVDGEATTVTVTSVANIVGSVDLSRLMPAIIVVPGPTDTLDDSVDGVFSEAQNWQIDVAVLTPPDHEHLASDFQLAGRLIGKVIAALAGLEVGPPYQRLAYQGRGEWENLTGRVHFPLLFRAVYAADPEAT